MNQPSDTLRLLRSTFGFSEFRPGQEQVIDRLLGGRSALAVFPTGSGKSLCYQLTALCLPGLTLVVSPLLALMKDQVDFLVSKGVAAARLDSTLGPEESSEILSRLNSGTLKILYVSPERCAGEHFRQMMQSRRVSLFAVDEAHCISQWGPNFRPEYLRLASFADEIRAERTLGLTATATPKVVSDIAESFRIGSDDIVNTGVYRSNLSLEFVPVEPENRDKLLAECDFSGPTIVYVTQRQTAEDIAGRLARRGLNVRAYHAGMPTPEREAVQNWFMERDDAVVVATVAFGMGIDKQNIRAVYHYNIPKGIESYIQEIGRAGRDGLPSLCRVFACAEDAPLLANFAYGDTPTEEAILGVLDEVFSGSSGDIELNLYELSRTHDIREVVLKTLLTHLQLDGFLKSRPTVHLLYEFKFHAPLVNVLSAVAPEFQERVQKFVAHAHKGPTWSKIDFGDAHKHLEPHRARAMEILDHLRERNLIELKASGVRHRFGLRRRPSDIRALAETCAKRFQEQERLEISRLREVFRLVEAGECQWGVLARYFGETPVGRCGHCTFCVTGEPVKPRRDAVVRDVSQTDVERGFSIDPDLFCRPRVLARFLCGITSPRLVTRKLTRHPDFGCLAARPFRDVLQAVESFLT